MTEVAFSLMYNADDPPLDLAEVEKITFVTLTRSDPSRGRASDFDAELHSDPTIFATAQWVVSSGLAVGVLKLLRDVLVKHLETRRSFVEVTVGKKKTTILAPMSRAEIERMLATLEPDPPE